jgi:hypothetical protein
VYNFEGLNKKMPEMGRQLNLKGLSFEQKDELIFDLWDHVQQFREELLQLRADYQKVVKRIRYFDRPCIELWNA